MVKRGCGGVVGAGSVRVCLNKIANKGIHLALMVVVMRGWIPVVVVGTVMVDTSVKLK